MRRLFLLVGLGLLASPPSCGFTDSSSRYSTRERQIEARTEGDVELRYGWADGSTLLVVAPLHAAAGRSDYGRARLDALTHAEGPRLWLAFSLWNFDPPAGVPGGDASAAPANAAAAVWRDGIPLTAAIPGTASGKVATLAPSKLLAGVTAPGARSLLETITGAGALVPPKGGQSLQIVAALPTAAALADLIDVQAALGSRTVALKPVSVPALQWDEFRSQPTRARFDALIQAKERAAGGVGAAVDTEIEGDERDPGK